MIILYISDISIEGYKNCKNKSNISFNPGLNIIVGENASGKSTIIDAIRMVLKEPEMGYITEDDFYKSFNKNETTKDIQIDLKFKNLTPDEKITFISWCNENFDAELHLVAEKNPNNKGYFKKSIWGGKSKSSSFEEEVFDFIDPIYLPALRNAEEKLKNGRKSRLALLLKHRYTSDDRKNELVSAFDEFNKSIINNENGKYNEISSAKTNINAAMKKSMGDVFGQSINLQFSESSFSSILQNIKMVFFPHIGETDEAKFRDVAINSLGYNNLLYIATVFAELEIANKNNSLFTVLLIEEPEAHLHPQIQSKLIKYLSEISTFNKNLQIILTTHSPVIASSVGIDSIVYINSGDDSIYSKKISDFEIDDNDKRYLNRWLDVTKSTLLFSKGVIFVEGISESLIIPSLSEKVLKEYNELHPNKKLPVSLEDAGVSVININGINFKYFFQLFNDLNGKNEVRIPIRCSGITDRDPIGADGKKIFPTAENEIVSSSNKNLYLVEKLNNSKNSKLFVARLKTFEYDLAMEGNCSLLAEILEKIWPKDSDKENGIKNKCKTIAYKKDNYDSEVNRRDDAKYIYEHIEDSCIGKGIFSRILLEKINNEKNIIIPEYIKNAIIWACGGNYDE